MTSRSRAPQPRDAATRRRLSAQGQRDTKPEIRLRSALHRRGLRYRVDCSIPVPRRRADIVFPKQRVAVFVDGCYWHGCPDHATVPKHNADWWRSKLEANMERDRDTRQRLEAEGWIVLRVWEHQDPEQAAAEIEAAVRSR